MAQVPVVEKQQPPPHATAMATTTNGGGDAAPGEGGSAPMDVDVEREFWRLLGAAQATPQPQL